VKAAANVCSTFSCCFISFLLFYFSPLLLSEAGRGGKSTFLRPKNEKNSVKNEKNSVQKREKQC
jgi:hypothetical protein